MVQFVVAHDEGDVEVQTAPDEGVELQVHRVRAAAEEVGRPIGGESVEVVGAFEEEEGLG